MDKQQIISLLNKYSQGQCTAEEQAWVETWYLNLQAGPLNNSVAELNADLDEVEQQLIEHTAVKRVTLWPRIAAAAAILLFVTIGGYLFLNKQRLVGVSANKTLAEILPGSNKAILTLANGKQLSLSDAKNGIILNDAGGSINKTNDGTISYEGAGSAIADQALAYNQITTPRGGQWSVILPDGTKVMLDAASSIKYPVRFGNERKVEITGQAYFEVVHNAAKPFRVITKTQVIEDIGTKFNVNAYNDEPFANTTLLEGAVKVSNPAAITAADKAGVILKPGQEAVLQGNKLIVASSNAEDALAWKDGYFRFNGEALESIMRKLSRWYNIDVNYKGDVSGITFNGDIPRNTNLSQVLKVLEAANVHFTIEGNKLTVTP